LKAYAAYQHWDTATYELVLQKVKDVVLMPAPVERDEADALASACPADLSRPGAEVCRTHPQYFIWPSDRFFIHDRPE
jgi:hypothetical protein